MKICFWGTETKLGDPKWVAEWLLPYYEARRRICVVTGSRELAEHLDDLLWELPGERFIAHALADESSAKHAPVVLAVQPDDLAGHAAVWLNLGPHALIPLPKGDELHEQVAGDESHKEQARLKFKRYRQEHMTPAFHEWTSHKA